MSSDRARVSYDEKQQYRSVVMQQGRATLEADWNEAQDIANEELRKETLDIVGANGTPDDGYRIFPRHGFDFYIKHGTMYVGGERVSLFDPSEAVPPGEDLFYSQQVQARQSADPPRVVDWLDAIAPDPDWLPVPTSKPDPELIYLQIREQEVSAVEDSDLKDAALGGPDTAQRTRLIQHVVRLPGGDCDLKLAQTRWATQGLRFSEKEMRLFSDGRLQLGFTSQTPPPDPCQPEVQGAYLGADNRLIRVEIASVGPDTNELLWGYDDASFLYRVDVVSPSTLQLQTAPVDTAHQPRTGQAIEVLLPAAQLSNGEFIAAPTGFVTTLSTAYNPDTQTIVLADALPIVYGDGTKANPSPPRVFLRVWEQQRPFKLGVAVPLGGSGLQVTLALASGGSNFHVGDFWVFAIRPATQQIYPQRVFDIAQPPDGPRLWVCPLGVITWGRGDVFGHFNDCRKFFSPVTELVFAEANGASPPVGPGNTLNFIGHGITVANNPTDSRTIDITIPTTGTSGESAPTLLLFPYATTAANFDTTIAVSNTTAGPFGLPQPSSGSGNCVIWFFPAPIFTTGGKKDNGFTFQLAPGDQEAFSLSSGDTKNIPAIPTNWNGYIIIECDFAGAYGYAMIGPINKGAYDQGLSFSYLPVILPRRGK